jgi:hypothetical protein
MVPPLSTVECRHIQNFPEMLHFYKITGRIFMDQLVLNVTDGLSLHFLLLFILLILLLFLIFLQSNAHYALVAPRKKKK